MILLEQLLFIITKKAEARIRPPHQLSGPLSTNLRTVNALIVSLNKHFRVLDKVQFIKFYSAIVL